MHGLDRLLRHDAHHWGSGLPVDSQLGLLCPVGGKAADTDSQCA